MSKLAIVIPAYKSAYFDQALLSIVNQKNKDFTLYIGDDCSPDNLYGIIEKYVTQIPIVYVRFDENLGKKDLVAHWERCIDLVGLEEWIWLFSDDDMMDSTCVEHFYETLKQYPDFDLYHFNVTKIDENGKKVMNFYTFPENLTSEEFLINKLLIGFFSTVVEYIFRKEHFILLERFQNFDLAWCSDDATWIKMANSRGVRNIGNSKVYWRTSQHNISSNNRDLEIIERKFNSRIKFTEWIIINIKSGRLQIEKFYIRRLLIKWFSESIKSNIEKLSFKQLKKFVLQFYFVVGMGNSPYKKLIFLIFYKVYRFLIRLCKKIIVYRT